MWHPTAACPPARPACPHNQPPLQVRTPGGQQSPFYDDLAKAAADAEAKGLGVHTKDRDAAAAAVRDLMSADGAPGLLQSAVRGLSCGEQQGQLAGAGACPAAAQCCESSVRPPPSRVPPSAEFDAAGLVARVGKGKPVDAIVEAVNSGSTLRVTILPDLQTATVMVAGVQCPSLGRRPPPSAAAPAASGEEGAAVPTTGPAPGSAAAAVAAGAAPTAAEGQPEAFSREAKYFTEQRTLHKEVKLILEGVSQVRAAAWVGPGLGRRRFGPALAPTERRRVVCAGQQACLLPPLEVLPALRCSAVCPNPPAVRRARGQRAVPPAARAQARRRRKRRGARPRNRPGRRAGVRGPGPRRRVGPQHDDHRRLQAARAG